MFLIISEIYLFLFRTHVKIGWNFHKFLIDENGRWVASIGSTTSPLSQEIVEWIEE